jgi:hypothetical protein
VRNDPDQIPDAQRDEDFYARRQTNRTDLLEDIAGRAIDDHQYERAQALAAVEQAVALHRIADALDRQNDLTERVQIDARLNDNTPGDERWAIKTVDMWRV